MDRCYFDLRGAIIVATKFNLVLVCFLQLLLLFVLLAAENCTGIEDQTTQVIGCLSAYSVCVCVTMQPCIAISRKNRISFLCVLFLLVEFVLSLTV